jgi:hypothetical protein
METRRKKQLQKNIFTMTSGGFVIIVTNVVSKRNSTHAVLVPRDSALESIYRMQVVIFMPATFFWGTTV